MYDFIDNLIICFIVAAFMLVLYGTISLIGLLIWKLRDRGRKIKGRYITGKCLCSPLPRF